MVWVLAVIVVGLIAVIAELFLTYQKRAHDLRLKQDPIRHKIRAHNKAMKESVERIQGAAESQLQELDRELPQRVQQIDNSSNSLRAVETKLFGGDAALQSDRTGSDFLSEEMSEAEAKKAKEEKDPNLVRAEILAVLDSSVEEASAPGP